MKAYKGNLQKMETILDTPIQYQLKNEEQTVVINEWIGKQVQLTYLKQINCKRCGRKTKTSFAQGFCYPCFKNAPESSPCIIHPEKCEGHLGKGRDVEWEQKHHVQEHIVYLAVSSGLKVGVTRQTQVPTRWIDQGASKAIRLAQTPNRYLAGCIEVALKEYVSDKTQWQKMLKNDIDKEVDLLNKKTELKNLLSTDLQAYISDNDDITELTYPVLEYPQKVKSINLTKVDSFNARLMGIKGQYLIFEGGQVFNVRSHSGYLVEITPSEVEDQKTQGSLF